MRSAISTSIVTALALALGLSPLATASTAHAQAELPPEIAAKLEAQAALIAALEARLTALEAQAQAQTQLPAAPVAQSPLAAQAARAPNRAPPSDAAAPAMSAAVEGPSLRGRAQVDALVFNNEDGSTATGTQVRRLNLGAEGELTPKLSWVAEADVSGGEVAVQDAYLAYRATPDLELTIGHFKAPATSEDMTSDNHTIFLERSAYAGAFAPGRKVGVAAHLGGARWGVKGGLFGEVDDGALDGALEGDRQEAAMVAVRGHADLIPGDPVLHMGLSAYHLRLADGDPGVRLSQRPETGRAPRAVDTGRFEADEGTFVGGEVGFGHGPLTLQGEGGSVAYDGPFVSPTFSGWSVQAAWRWTGEPRSYDAVDGVFGRVRPFTPCGRSGLDILLILNG